MTEFDRCVRRGVKGVETGLLLLLPVAIYVFISPVALPLAVFGWLLRRNDKRRGTDV